MDDFGLLVGRHYTALPTLTDEQPSEVMLDASGRLIIAGRYAVDTASAASDSMLLIGGQRRDANTTIATADGQYAPFQLDDAGFLKVTAKITVSGSDAEYVHGSAYTSGTDVGIFTLAVKQTALAADANVSDGDFAAHKVNATGELYVIDTDANALLTTIDADTGSMTVSLTSLGTLVLAEDAVATDGGPGLAPFLKRQDTLASDTSADGDLGYFKSTDVGELYVHDADVLAELQGGIDVTLTPPGTEQYTVSDALAAAADGLITITAAATPWVTVASFAHTSGTAYIYGWQFSCDQNCQARIMTDDTTDEIVYKTDVNSSAEPGVREHWSSDGRIEITGAAGLEIRIEMKKRGTPGGNANGTGSLHIRTVA